MDLKKAVEMTIPRIDSIVKDLINSEVIPKSRINVHVFIQRYSDYFATYDPDHSDPYLLEEWITRVAHGHELEVDLVDENDRVIDTIPPIMSPKKDVRDMVFHGNGSNIAARLEREVRHNKNENAIEEMSVSLMDSYLDQRKINENKERWAYILNKYNSEYYNDGKDISVIDNKSKKESTKIEDIEIDYD